MQKYNNIVMVAHIYINYFCIYKQFTYLLYKIITYILLI